MQVDAPQMKAQSAKTEAPGLGGALAGLASMFAGGKPKLRRAGEMG